MDDWLRKAEHKAKLSWKLVELGKTSKCLYLNTSWADLQIMVYLDILVTRKFLASQKIFSETTVILLRKWTFDGNNHCFEMKMLLLRNNFIFALFSILKISISKKNSNTIQWQSMLLNIFCYAKGSNETFLPD